MVNKFELSSVVLRIVLGITFFVHGLTKFQGGIENTAGWFETIGLPGFLAYAVAAIELVGGIALVLGLFSRYISGILAILMIGAIVKVKLAAGFLGNGQAAGYELDLALLAMAVSLAVTGSNTFSLDSLIVKGKNTANGTSLNLK